MKDFFYRLAIEEDGPTAVEYAVVLAAIVLACVASVMAMSNQMAMQPQGPIPGQGR